MTIRNTEIHFILIIVLAMSLLLHPAELHAEAPVPEDFAYGLPIMPEERGPVYRIRLPESVYRHVTRTDLGDMRVFNGRGEPVPHALRRPQPRKGKAPAPVSLNFFPVYDTGDEKTGSIWFQITTDEAGAILRTRPEETGPASGSITAYLIDASGLKHLPDALRLDWTQPGDSFVAQVSVSVSSDLDRWRNLISSATLARLRYGDRTLGRTTIPLPGGTGKYIRLSWPVPGSDIRITSVTAAFTPPSAAPAEREERLVPGTAVPDAPGVYQFDTGGHYPADQLNLRLPEPNSLAEGALFSRSAPDMPWQFRQKGVFYHLIVGEDTELVNDPVSLSPVTDRYWRLEIPSAETGLGGGIPDLRLAWEPHELLFLARGAEPFTLAYGSAAVPPAGRTADPLLRTVHQGDGSEALVKPAAIREPVTLGGETALTPPPPPLPWKTWILWTVLVLGVLTVGWMAWQLYRQMNIEEKQ